MNEKSETIQEVIALLNSPFATTLLGFLLGFFSQSILELRKKRKEKKEFNSFDSMLENDYIIPCDNLLEKYFLIDDSTDVGLVKKRINETLDRLTYLKKNEIYFLKSNNQFKMIRLIEFTKLYFLQLDKTMSYYHFKDTNATQEEYDEDKLVQKEKIKKIKEEYSKNKKNYLNLSVDRLVK